MTCPTETGESAWPGFVWLAQTIPCVAPVPTGCSMHDDAESSELPAHNILDGSRLTVWDIEERVQD